MHPSCFRSFCSPARATPWRRIRAAVIPASPQTTTNAMTAAKAQSRASATMEPTAVTVASGPTPAFQTAPVPSAGPMVAGAAAEPATQDRNACLDGVGPVLPAVSPASRERSAAPSHASTASASSPIGKRRLRPSRRSQHEPPRPLLPSRRRLPISPKRKTPPPKPESGVFSSSRNPQARASSMRRCCSML